MYKIGKITLSKWANEHAPGVEGLGALNLIKEINKRTSHLEIGEIIICTDMRK